jgi:predicted DNA-binding antitoxin AbrB/MazE fold protein
MEETAMNKVLQATYHDGSLVLDEKLDAALEGKKIALILVEAATESKDDIEQTLEPRKQRFLEQLQQHSFKLPEDYRFNREELYE